MLRWGILSTAKIGRDHVVPAILNSSNGVVTAVASRDMDRAQQFATRFAIPHCFDDYDEMLASDHIDAAYIPTITSEHAHWSIRAADAGKHVLCEKPIALHATQIDAIIDARNRNQVLVCEAFMVTYHPQWQKVRRLIQNGAIGSLKKVQGAFTYFNDDPKNMRNIREQGGGALLDIGVYPSVVTRFVTGSEPRKISAIVERATKDGTDDYASWHADFGSFKLNAYVSTKMAQRQQMSFHGDKGWINIAAPFNAGIYDADVVTLHNQNNDSTQTFRFSGINQYQLQVEAFARAVSGADEEVFTLENSKLNQSMIDAIFRAGESGGWETV